MTGMARRIYFFAGTLALALLLCCLAWQRRAIAKLRLQVQPPPEATLSEDNQIETLVEDAHIGEIVRLQAEIQRMQKQLAEAELVHQTNQLLREELQSLASALSNATLPVANATLPVARPRPVPESEGPDATRPASVDPDKLEAHKKLVICASQLKQIGIAAQLWYANTGRWPEDFASLRHHLAPMILVCPEDTSKPRQFTLSWASFDVTRITYKLSRSREWEVTCPIHRGRVNDDAQVFVPKFVYDHAWGGYVPH